ncbi:hypothetical protein HBH70_033450 [Parastagonospora nodorum]|nr:hypothetical protein HBH75_148040 [Parastagonospora nodorum]KAH4938786.1 hypothetical protein HBI79_058500 [Parastagonospora nodorum]KAH5028198.1 hypothetical protein HBI74_117850 [Parastagonospora nodorum]KAH5078982.1 hypothetical protein HBH95_088170 [Parastagonospora nodorum]KAH5148949.1 hypothetical protein HBH70_033450 [Parastagonospora nodorum]
MYATISSAEVGGDDARHLVRDERLVVDLSGQLSGSSKLLGARWSTREIVVSMRRDISQQRPKHTMTYIASSHSSFLCRKGNIQGL